MIRFSEVPAAKAKPEKSNKAARSNSLLESNRSSKAKFDKAAYQRDYMRRRRAKLKDGEPK